MKNSYSFKRTLLVLTVFWLIPNTFFAQIAQKYGDNSYNINENAILELESTNKGFLLPRMDQGQRDRINNPTEGLMIWCTNCSPSNESEISIWINRDWKGLLISDLPSTNIFLGNGAGKATPVNMTGDLTIDGAGTTSITPNAVTTAKILNSNVSYPKIQNVNLNTILGRITTSAGIVEEIPITGTVSVAMSNSPTLTGVPLAPTAAVNTNTDQIASTAFVLANSNGYNSINASNELSTTSTTDVVVTGMSLTPGTGNYSVTFNSEFNSKGYGTTSSAVTDLETAYQVLLNKPTTAPHADSFGSGETLGAGVYQTTGAGSIAGSLTLNGTSTDLFIFKINGAFSTSIVSSITLTGGAQASNVFWIAISAGAMSIAGNNQMKGTFIARDGAALIANGSTLEGRLVSNVGAVSTNANTISIPLGNSSINLGKISSYALFTGSGALSNTGTSTITGNICSNLGPITGFEVPTVVNGFIKTLLTEENNALTSFSLYQNGIIISNSSRSYSNTNGQIILSAIATVSDGQAIDVRWKTSLGEVKLQNRILTLIKVR